MKIVDSILSGKRVGYIIFAAAVVLALLLLGGCTPKYIYKTQTRYEVVPLPEEMFNKCPTTVPPDKAAYVASSDSEKENTLANYGVALVGDVAKCNAQVEGIRKKQAENKQLVEKRNKDLKPDGEEK